MPVEGPYGGPRSIFDGFWGSLGRAWGTGLRKSRSLVHEFPLHVFRMAPDLILRRFQGPWRPLEIDMGIYTTIVRNQGSHKFGLRWIRDASGLDFGVILEAGVIIFGALGLLFLVLEGPRDMVDI